LKIQPSAKPGHADLVWASSTGEYFTLESTTNLQAGFTQVLQTNILATPPQNVVSMPTDGSRFYRLRY
jgi:hypothetical protein